MRQIKFRAWDKNRKVMFFGSPVYLYSGTKNGELNYLCEYITGSHLSKKALDGAYEFELMQYTGLKDKHGKEIYEGDIYKVIFNNEETPGIVIYNHGGFRIKFSFKSNPRSIGTNSNKNNGEVIGNIYENKELLI